MSQTTGQRRSTEAEAAAHAVGETDCDLSMCGEDAEHRASHPQRGTMLVCPFHYENIKALRRTEGGGDR